MSYEYNLKKIERKDQILRINEKIKIATILPYKENYTFSKAQAAAIWVSIFINLKFKKNNFIFGNTNTKDF